MSELPSSLLELVERSSVPVLVDFYAHWCGPCKVLAPALNEIAKMLKGQIMVVKVDVDQKSRLAAYFNVQAVPTLLLLYKGEALWRHSGVLPAKQLADIIRSEIKKLTSV